ncbi:hypothetical protein G9A89_011541 [Geosiphon pyriformis]|nr:hypothetical protein G9A89_011541 [Geosiphon pyriformis]
MKDRHSQCDIIHLTSTIIKLRTCSTKVLSVHVCSLQTAQCRQRKIFLVFKFIFDLHLVRFSAKYHRDIEKCFLTIAQGVSNHINNNAERFRYCFVKYEGQKEISIFAGDILDIEDNQLKGDWPVAINRLTTKVDENVTKVDLSKTLECDFSTTTSASITASRVILLDSMKKYFTYKILCLCGIPKVTLEGSLQDWQKLQEKVVKLREFGLDMDFWLDRLEPVVWKLVETFRDNIDQDFWSKAIMSRAQQESFEEGDETAVIFSPVIG